MAQFRALLRTLVEHEVQFIVVGGVAAVLQGAPILTRDLDILYCLDPSNVERLHRVLRALGAVFRDDARNIAPDISHLASRGHKLLTTRLGELDCLGTIEEDTTYEDLLHHVDVVTAGELSIQVITLERLIQVKRKLTRPKDRLALMQLEATLEERRSRKDT
jgi:predicted nucleotidyltransferase